MSYNCAAGYTEPVAIVGMSCRLPGGASSTPKLWDLLIEGRSGHCEMPISRFNAESFYHQNPEKPGTVNATGGYFIQDDIRKFDNTFFGINNLETKYMDPQQRQLLEVVFECLESAGAMLHEVSGTNTGCYVANFTTDYVTMQAKDPDSYHRYSATGFGPTILANRINHVFNLKGPSVVLDTACSSSLYALHVACAALTSGECDAAIVAGANLVQSPEAHLAMVKAGVLSGTSTCHSFDICADGYGRGEGVGALYLKKLSSATNHMDPIRCVVRGTAVNSNGHTPGIALPSVAGQEAVIRKAYNMSGLRRDQTVYVEAHGTGTPVGDPIEVEALSRALCLESGNPILIGSVKTNLGHSEAVSGIASVIKVALALENSVIPPTLGIQTLNPELKLEERNIEVVTHVRPWPEGTIPRASINSFGYGGANAHAILEAASIHVREGYERTTSSKLNQTFVLPFSAHCPKSLADSMMAITALKLSSSDLPDLAYTLGCRRSRLPVAGYLLANGKSLDNNLLPENFRTLAPGSSTVPFAFVFTGQGAQWPKMGCELLGRFPTYRRIIRDLDTCLSRLSHPPSWTIEESILAPAESSNIQKASHSQPVCTATQIALVQLLKEWNILPKAVLGHSSGEICAAFAAGHVTADEAITIAYYRGLTVSKISVKGAMMALGLGRGKVDELLSKLALQDKVCVACINSAESTTVSGDSDAIDGLLQTVQGQEIFARKLKTNDKAYHSHLMKPIGQEYQELLHTIFSPTTANHVPLAERSQHIGKPHVDMFSSTTGQLVVTDTVRSAWYWRTNLESPVLFSDSLEKLLLSQSYHMIEIGPHPTLGQPIRETQKSLQIEEDKIKYTPTLSRGKNAEITMLDLAGNLYLCGHKIPFGKVNELAGEREMFEGPSLRGRVMHSLPTYPWHHDEVLWSESRISSGFRNRNYKHHDLLGSRIFGNPNKPMSWRKILKTKETSWLKDHKLGQTVVFPGSGYLVMAMEGLRQVQGVEFAMCSSIVFRQVHLINALVLSDDQDGIEVFTTMEPARLSGIASSDVWWQFEISSNNIERSTVHAFGFLSLNRTPATMGGRFRIPPENMENQSLRIWYDKLAKEGLSFGTTFQSLTELYTHRSRTIRHAMSKTILQRGAGCGQDQQSQYFIHPITIDALLQTAIIASAAGTIHNLRGKVPVYVGRLEIATGYTAHSADLCTVHAGSEKVGFETAILSAELENTAGQILIQMDDVRAIPYAEKLLRSDVIAERDPGLRVLWKPDISRISPESAGALTSYIDRFACLLPEIFTDEPESKLFAGALDLMTHQNPRMRILELDNNGGSRLEEILNVTGIGASQKRFESYIKASMAPNGILERYKSQESGSLAMHDLETNRLEPGAAFDAIVIPLAICVDTPLSSILVHLTPYLALNAVLLFSQVSQTTTSLEKGRFSMLSANLKERSITIARASGEERLQLAWQGLNVIFVDANETHGFNRCLLTNLSKSFGQQVAHVSFRNMSSSQIPPQSIVVTTIELEESILARMTDSELQAIKVMTDNASILLWITGGALFKAQRPLFSLVLGLSRSMMLERPSLKMPVLDLDNISSAWNLSSESVIFILRQAMHKAKPDYEYRQYNGTLYNSRFIPDLSINKQFRHSQNAEIIFTSIKEAGHCQLSMRSVGQIDTIHFEQQQNLELLPQCVKIQVKSVGINAKDFYTVCNKVDTKESTCALEFSGVVIGSNSKESKFTPGDRVVVMAPNHFSTFECVPEWACCKLRDDEDFATLATIPLVFSTAIYGLEHRARLQPGESVLIHSAAGGLGIAAIQIAQLIGAEIFATVGTVEKKSFLIETYGLKEDHIFNSHDSSFLTGILALTSNHGVDVVLNSLTGDLLHDSWEVCADDGRFVEVGKRDISDSGRLDMQVFSRGVTFTAFDLTSLYWSKSKSKREVWHKLLGTSVQLLREGKIKPIRPLEIFNASDVVRAFRHFSLGTRIGKVAVSFEDPESQLKIVPVRHRTIFNPAKTYLLVGCLGGLGRSLLRWMLQRGARSFVLIGRSGTEKIPARNLVADLKAAGADVVVIRGDVTLFSDVARAVEVAPRPIGGIIHAAMGIQVALFTDMSSETWHMGISQKVNGAWNLHHALQGKDSQLDFFLILSSITGSIGTATESNYCAANSFLDSFACHRRSLGLPATSVGLGMISEVGFLHDNPGIEAVLLRKGVHPLTEDELLQIIDIAVTPPAADPLARIDESFGADHYVQGHILTGLELHGFQKIRDQGFKRPTQMLEDPRCAIIAGAFAASSNSDNTQPSNGGNNRNFPRTLLVALASNEGKLAPNEALLTAVQGVVAEKIGTLLLVPPTQLKRGTQLAEFGMESMLAAEFRSDMFRAFEVDVPFAVLLDGRTSVGGLAEFVARGLLEARTQNKA